MKLVIWFGLIYFAAIFAFSLVFLTSCARVCHVEYVMENGVHCLQERDVYTFFYSCTDGNDYVNPWNVQVIKVCR